MAATNTLELQPYTLVVAKLESMQMFGEQMGVVGVDVSKAAVTFGNAHQFLFLQTRFEEAFDKHITETFRAVSDKLASPEQQVLADICSPKPEDAELETTSPPVESGIDAQRTFKAFEASASEITTIASLLQNSRNEALQTGMTVNRLHGRLQDETKDFFCKLQAQGEDVIGKICRDGSCPESCPQ